METSHDFTSFATPLDDFLQKYIPREHEKALRSSVIQAVAIVSVGIIFFGLYYVYSILEPFCVPLFWAFLTGLVLHPYKRRTTNGLRMSLESLAKSDQTMVLALSLTTLSQLDRLLETVGTFITKRWKLLVSVFTVIPITYIVCYFFPSAFEVLLVILRNILLVDLSQFLNSISLHHVISSAVICLVSIVFGGPQYKILYQTSSIVTWVLLAFYLMNFLWPPFLQMLLVFWLYGYFTQVDSDDEADGTDNSRFRSVILSFLQKISLLPVNNEDETDNCGNKSTEEENVVNPKESTPLPTSGVGGLKTELKKDEPKMTLPLESTPKITIPLESTPKVGIIQHPGVSALKKEHGVLRLNSRDKPNISVIERVTIGGNTPHRSRLLGRSYFRVKRRTSSLTELETMHSMTYIYGALWACALVQLWLRPSLMHLLPIPLAYHVIKRLAVSTGLSTFLGNKLGLIWSMLMDWLTEHWDLLMPPPLAGVIRVSYKLERRVLKGIILHLDSIVTALMILAMVLGMTFIGVFIFFQVYSETVYVVQSVGNIASSLNMSDSYIFSRLNQSFDSMENMAEQVHDYGRGWISSTLKSSLSEADPGVREDLESKIVVLWDRSYQYWVVTPTEKDRDTLNVGPIVTGEAITYSVGEVFQRLYSSSGLFNMSAAHTFLQNNMGTLTSILEQVWTLFKGNIGFLSDSILGLLRIVLHGGSGVVNFVFGVVIYLTALFYLLSNSGVSYIPMDVVSQYSLFQISGVGSSLQKAVNSVFLITVKMSSFYLLWTYLTHVIFQASIVVLPLLFSSFLAACPFTGQQVVAIPAALELWLLQERPIAALMLVMVQVAPSWLVDAAIYSEIKGGIHPWFTGLAVVGGVYVFGVLGAIYGPLALCILYVVMNVYSTFMVDTEPDTPDLRQRTSDGSGITMRTPLLRSGTII